MLEAASKAAQEVFRDLGIETSEDAAADAGDSNRKSLSGGGGGMINYRKFVSARSVATPLTSVSRNLDLFHPSFPCSNISLDVYQSIFSGSVLTG